MQLSDLKIGDNVFDISIDQVGVINDFYNNVDHPICVEFPNDYCRCYTSEGKYRGWEPQVLFAQKDKRDMEFFTETREGDCVYDKGTLQIGYVIDLVCDTVYSIKVEFFNVFDKEYKIYTSEWKFRSWKGKVLFI